MTVCDDAREVKTRAEEAMARGPGTSGELILSIMQELTQNEDDEPRFGPGRIQQGQELDMRDLSGSA